MAEKIALSLEIETGKSVKTLGQLEHEVQNVNREFLNLSQTNIDLKKQLKDLEKHWELLPKSMRGMFGVTKEIFTELKEQIKDNNE